MLARKFIRRVHLHVATRAQRRLVGAAYQRRRRLLAHITLDLHISSSSSSSPSTSSQTEEVAIV
jgi:hypothetical protein